MDQNKTDSKQALSAGRKALALLLAFALAFTAWDPLFMRSAFAAEPNAAALEESEGLPENDAESEKQADAGIVESEGEPEPESVGGEGDSDGDAVAIEEPASETGITGEEPADPQVQGEGVAEQSTFSARAGPDNQLVSCVVTFYGGAEGSNPAILKRQQVSSAPGDVVTVDVSSVHVVPPTSTQAFAGWSYLGQTVTTSIDVNPADGNVNLYPVFTSGHWLRFNAGNDNGEATETPSQFVGVAESSLPTLGVPSRTGYSFAGWHYGTETADGIEYGDAATAADGGVIDEQGLLARLDESDVTLYANWQPARSSFRVFTWLQNPDDNGYSYEGVTTYGDADDEVVYTGDRTDNITYPGFEGFNAPTFDAKTVAGNGSTTVNLYYDRITYDIVFHSGRSSIDAIIPELTITARYGADIHALWPGTRPGTESYSSAWYTQPGDDATVFVSGVGTMPLNGAHYYMKTDTGTYCNALYLVQGIDGKNTFSLYKAEPFTTANSPWTTADDYKPIKGFMVNAASGADALAIRAIAGGDKNAVSNGSYDQSCAVGAQYEEADLEAWGEGPKRYTLRFYYLRCKYNVMFEENGGHETADATGIYYEASLADAAPDDYVVGETEKTEPNGVTYVFQGWYDNPSFADEPFDFASATMDAGNIVLYAKWEPVSYLVQLDPNGGTFADSGQSSYFWVDHGASVGTVNVERDYVMDAAGAYVYDFSTYASEAASGNVDGFGEASYVLAQSQDEGERYRYEDGAYNLFGWYEVMGDALSTEPFDFNEPVTSNTTVRAVWAATSMVDVAYHTQASYGDVVVSGAPIPAREPGYAEGAMTFAAPAPTSVAASDGSAWDFVGWQLVSEFGNEPAWADEAIYLPGDEFTIDLSKATDGVIHFQAVYEPGDEPSDEPGNDPADDPADDPGDSATSNSGEASEASSEASSSSTSEAAASETPTALPKTGDDWFYAIVPWVLLGLAAALVAFLALMRRRQ